jgi:hypothetical protein
MRAKDIIQLMLASILLVACNHGKENNVESQKKQDVKTEWKNRYKNLVLCNCVVAGLADSTVRMKLLMMDKSFHDPINIVMEDDIKNVIAPIISEIKRDSIVSLTTVGEGAQGKTVFSHCLKFYNCKKLDSLTNIKFTKWNHMNIDSIMSVKAPAY